MSEEDLTGLGQYQYENLQTVLRECTAQGKTRGQMANPGDRETTGQMVYIKMPVKSFVLFIECRHCPHKSEISVQFVQRSAENTQRSMLHQCVQCHT